MIETIVKIKEIIIQFNSIQFNDLLFMCRVNSYNNNNNN
jgi:hypothetical protein